VSTFGECNVRCVTVMFTATEQNTILCFLTTVLVWDSNIDIHCVFRNVLYTVYCWDQTGSAGAENIVAVIDSIGVP
jgi:hypothetical protein